MNPTDIELAAAMADDYPQDDAAISWWRLALRDVCAGAADGWRRHQVAFAVGFVAGWLVMGAVLAVWGVR